MMTITDAMPDLVRLHTVDVRGAERRSLRRDLHDSFGPAIFGLRLAVDGALKRLDVDPESCREAIEAVHDELGRLGEHLRLFSHSLLPPELEAGDLQGALVTLARRFDTESLRVTIEVDPALRAEEAAREIIYHVAGEALTNTHRHARASRCDVRVIHSAAGIELHVIDDGIGIDLRSRRLGVGTTSMRERVEEVGGVFYVGPRLPAVHAGGRPGTHVRVLLPFAS